MTMEEMKDKLNTQEPLEEAYFNCLIDHLYGSEWDGQWDCDFEIDTDDNTKVKQILERPGNILCFAGHTHDSLVSDVSSIRNNGTVTYINTASVGNTEPCGKTVRSLKSFRDKSAYPQLEEYFCRRSMGIRVEVYDSHYIVRGVDFTQNKYSPQCITKIMKKGANSNANSR